MLLDQGALLAESLPEGTERPGHFDSGPAADLYEMIGSYEDNIGDCPDVDVAYVSFKRVIYDEAEKGDKLAKIVIDWML